MNKQGLGLLNEAVKSGNFVILDTETSGVDNHAEILQIAIVGSDGSIKLNSLVKPVSTFIPKEATAVHGLTIDKLQSAPSIRALLPTIRAYLTKTNVIVYNEEFDHRMLVQSLALSRSEPVAWYEIAQWHCAMKAFALIKGEWNDYRKSYKWHRLEAACTHYGIKQKDAHDALGDCMATLEVCRYMAGLKTVEKAEQLNLFD